VLRRCSILAESASIKNVKKIDKTFIVSHHSKDVDNNMARTMWHLASKSERHKSALGGLYFFSDAMERESLDLEKGWDVFRQLVAGKISVTLIDPAYISALYFVSDRVQVQESDVYRRIKADIAGYLNDWCTEGLTIDDFVSVFRLKPVHPKDFDPAILQKVKATSFSDDVKWYVENARISYEKANDQSTFPGQVVTLCWKTVEFMVKAYLLKEGAVDPGHFADDKVGDDRYIDEIGRIRRKSTTIIADEARQLMTLFDDVRREKRLYVKTYDQMRLLLRKREQFLKAPLQYKAESIQIAKENEKICRVAVRQVYSELISLLL
jgi:hypothetical protein